MPGLGVLAGVDDQALRARLGGHQVAIGGERAGWEPGDKHGPTSLGAFRTDGGMRALAAAPGYRCAQPSGEPVTATSRPRGCRYHSRSFAGKQAASSQEERTCGGKKERQRRLARERMLRQQARRAERARRTRQITMIAVVCLVVVGLGVGGFFLFASPARPATRPRRPPPRRPRPVPPARHRPRQPPRRWPRAGQDVQLPDHRDGRPQGQPAARPSRTTRPRTRPPSTPTAATS